MKRLYSMLIMAFVGGLLTFLIMNGMHGLVITDTLLGGIFGHMVYETTFKAD